MSSLPRCLFHLKMSGDLIILWVVAVWNFVMVTQFCRPAVSSLKSLLAIRAGTTYVLVRKGSPSLSSSIAGFRQCAEIYDTEHSGGLHQPYAPYQIQVLQLSAPPPHEWQKQSPIHSCLGVPCNYRAPLHDSTNSIRCNLRRPLMKPRRQVFTSGRSISCAGFFF